MFSEYNQKVEKKISITKKYIYVNYFVKFVVAYNT